MHEDRNEPTTTRHATAIGALAVLAPALGGSTQLWAQAVLLLAAAALVILSPPRRSLGPLWNSLFLGVMTFALTSFLPAKSVGIPEWREMLTANHPVTLADTASPQPWLSAEAACLIFSGLVFSYYLIALSWDPPSRRRAARLYVAGIVILAIAALVSLLTGHKVPFWPAASNSSLDFGFFPNRNQTANVLALAGIMSTALAFDAFGRRRKLAWFWTASVIILSSSLVLSYSRAGIVLFLGGIAAWVLVSFSFSASSKGAALGTAAVALLLTLFLVFGGSTLERFRPSSENPATDFRIPIHTDALRLSASAPWLGQGLGNFDGVFAMARAASAAQNHAIHPESDWLWTAVEMGWPATILFLAMFVLWLNQCYPFSAGSDRPVRSAALVCGVAFALHAGIDVSGHRPGSAWPAILLAALALNSDRRLTPRRWVAPVFRVFGLILAAIACWWITSILSERAAKIAPTSHTLARLQQQIDRDSAQGQYEAVRQGATEALRIAPLNSALYYQRGVARVSEGFSAWGASRDFHTARFLDPHWAELCFSEGKIWLAVDLPEQALDAWGEALRRAEKRAPSYYGSMLNIAKSNIAVRSALQELTQSNIDYLLEFLQGADRLECELEISRLLDADPLLKSLTKSQRQRLFAAWFAQGDRNLLASRLETESSWQKDGWPWLARYYANDKQFERAYRTATQFGTAPALPRLTASTPLVEAERTFLSRPDDLLAGLALYLAQRTAGNMDNALATVRELQKIKGCPPYVTFLEAELSAQQGNWEAAWTAWQRFAGPEPR